MSIKTNRVCHEKGGSSDKVYITSIERIFSGEYRVVGKYGKCHGNIKTSDKGTYRTPQSADAAADEIHHKRCSDGQKNYTDIENSSYRHGLKMNTPWLKSHLSPSLDEETVAKARVAAPKPKPAPKFKELDGTGTITVTGGFDFKVHGGFEVICTNNIGLETSFDRDIEYLAEKHDDSEMLWVYDKLGKRVAVFAERFHSAEMASA